MCNWNVCKYIFACSFFRYFVNVDLENEDEFRPKYVEFLTDLMYTRCTDRFAKLLANHSVPTYQYLFDYRGQYSIVNLQGTIHILRKHLYSTKLKLITKFFIKTGVFLSKQKSLFFKITFWQNFHGVIWFFSKYSIE